MTTLATRSSPTDPRKIAIGDMFDATRKIAETLGRSPRVKEYVDTRRRLQANAAHRGELLLFPSYSAVHRLFPDWDGFLRAAGLPPLGGSRTGGGHGGGRKITCTAEVCFAAINMVRAELGDPITAKDYADWRAQKISVEPTLGYSLPSIGSIQRRFPTWRDDVLGAIASSRPVGASPEMAIQNGTVIALETARGEVNFVPPTNSSETDARLQEQSRNVADSFNLDPAIRNGVLRDRGEALFKERYAPLTTDP